MDDFFDKLKDGAGKAKDGAEKIAKEVAKRTSNAITHTKLSFSINETRNKVKEACSEIGKLVYKKHLDGEELDETFSDILAQIDALMEEEKILTEKLNELKNTVTCPACGAKTASKSKFCVACGIQLIEDDELFDEKTIEEYDIDEDVIIIEPKKPE